MPILLGVAPPKPSLARVAGPEWNGARVMWRGWDGSEWELTNRMSPVVLIEGGVRGFGRPTFRRFTSAAPAVAGTRWRGFNTDEREVFLPLLLWSQAGTADFLDYDEAFSRTLRPDMLGMLTVTAGDGRSTRTLRCRFTDDEESLERDPNESGWQKLGIRLMAEQPYWRGERRRYPFVQADPQEFYGAPGEAFVVRISPGNTIDSATVPNPGDVPVYLKHYIHGPTTTVTIRGTQFPFAIADGKAVVLDTAPTSQAALEANVSIDENGEYVYALTGVDKSSLLGSVDFSPIQPGSSVPVSMTMVGGGRVITEVTPLFFKAWG